MCKLVFYSSLYSLRKVNRNLDDPNQVTFSFEENSQEQNGVGQSVSFPLWIENGNECVSLICKNMRTKRIEVKKNYQKKKRILASDVISTAINAVNIEWMLRKTEAIEKSLEEELSYETVHALMQLY